MLNATSAISCTIAATLNNIAQNANFAGVAFGMQSGAAIRAVKAPDGSQLLRGTKLFSTLSDNDLNSLASKLVTHTGNKGEFLFQQGGAIASLFMVVEGAFEIVVSDGQDEKRIAVISPGHHIGELSLLTGASNPATVRALTRFHVFEITKDNLAIVMKENPHVLHAIETNAAEALGTLEKYTMSSQPGEHPTHLIDKIRSFFDIHFVRLHGGETSE